MSPFLATSIPVAAQARSAGLGGRFAETCVRWLMHHDVIPPFTEGRLNLETWQAVG